MKLPTDAEIEEHRVAGEITLVLEHGSAADRQSLLRFIASIASQERADELASQYPSKATH